MPKFEERIRLSPATMALATRVDKEPIVAAVVAAVSEDVYAAHIGNPTFRQAVCRSVRDNVESILRLFAGQATLDEIRPPAAFSLTDLLAELGIPVGDLERSYWVGSSAFWVEWFAVAEKAAEEGEATLAELVGPPTMVMFEYLIEVLRMVVARHDAVSTAIRASRDDRRRELLAQLTDGSIDTSTEDIEEILGYRLGGQHVAIAIASATRVEAEQLSNHLARGPEAQGSLLLMHSPALWLLWLRFPAGRPVDPIDRIRRAAADGVAAICVGSAGWDLRGFLQSREDALETASLRRWFADVGGNALCFSDIHLEALLLRDEARARRFVAGELGELDAGDDRIERIRSTVLDWLSSGSTSQTAARQFVHENTIRTRLAQAEQLLHRDLSIRRAELMAALRLRAVLGPSVVDPR
jgi:hypothetical protein